MGETGFKHKDLSLDAIVPDGRGWLSNTAMVAGFRRSIKGEYDIDARLIHDLEQCLRQRIVMVEPPPLKGRSVSKGWLETEWQKALQRPDNKFLDFLCIYLLSLTSF